MIIMPNINMYWWNKAPNFGDALSPKIVELCIGEKVQWTPINSCDLVALGSTLDFLRTMNKEITKTPVI